MISASVSRLIYGALEARGGTGSATVIPAIVLCAVTYLVLCLVLKVIGIDEFGKLLSLRTEKIKN